MREELELDDEPFHGLSPKAIIGWYATSDKSPAANISANQSSRELELEAAELDELDELELEPGKDGLGEVKFGSSGFTKMLSVGLPPIPGHVLLSSGLHTVRITCGSLFCCVNSVAARHKGHVDGRYMLSCASAACVMHGGQKSCPQPRLAHGEPSSNGS